MKSQVILFGMIFCLFFGSASAQEKQLKTNTKKEISTLDQLDRVLESKNFEFVASLVVLVNGTTKNLSGGGYTVTFSPGLITSELPYYGKVYSGYGATASQGLQFKGKPRKFTVKKEGDYQIDATVNDFDSYKISLSVSESGYAKLTISSGNRQTISFRGEIVETGAE